MLNRASRTPHNCGLWKWVRFKDVEPHVKQPPKSHQISEETTRFPPETKSSPLFQSKQENFSMENKLFSEGCPPDVLDGAHSSYFVHYNRDGNCSPAHLETLPCVGGGGADSQLYSL